MNEGEVVKSPEHVTTTLQQALFTPQPPAREKFDRYISRYSPFNPGIGLARTVIAFALLATIMSTPTSQLFFRSESFPAGVTCLAPLSKYSLFCIAGEAGQLDVAVWSSVLVLTLAGIGILPAFTAIPHWYVTWSFTVGSPVLDGGDHLAANLTLLLILLSVLDRRRWHWQRDVAYPSRQLWVKHVGYAALALWCLQLFIVYFQAAVAKFGVAEWADGTALWYWMQHPTFGPAEPLQELVLTGLQNPTLVVGATYGALAFQVTLAFAPLFAHKFRYIYLALAIVFHLAIAVLMGLWSFSAIMIAADVVFLLRPHELQERSHASGALLPWRLRSNAR